MIAIKKGTRKINSSENLGPKRNKLKKSEPGKRKKLWKKRQKGHHCQSINWKDKKGTYQTPPTAVTQKYR